MNSSADFISSQVRFALPDAHSGATATERLSRCVRPSVRLPPGPQDDSPHRTA